MKETAKRFLGMEIRQAAACSKIQAHGSLKFHSAGKRFANWMPAVGVARTQRPVNISTDVYGRCASGRKFAKQLRNRGAICRGTLRATFDASPPRINVSASNVVK